VGVGFVSKWFARESKELHWPYGWVTWGNRRSFLAPVLAAVGRTNVIYAGAGVLVLWLLLRVCRSAPSFTPNRRGITRWLKC
jgi:hypothetical protein